MENYVFNLKFTAKALGRESKKSEKESKKSKTKCKKAMEKGQLDVAKIHAENAIRQKNESLNYLKLGSRLEAVASRVNTAVKMNSLTKSMGGVVKSMDTVLQTMDVEKITSIMDKFESQFADLDIRSEYMENAMSNTSAMTTPETEVDDLMHQIADENQIEFTSALDAAPIKKKEDEEDEVKEAAEEDDLEARLKNLQGI